MNVNVRRRKWVGTLAAGMSAALIVTGCSSSGSSGSNASGGKTLTLWESAVQKPNVAPMIAAFEKKTGIKIKPTVFPTKDLDNAILTKWASGARPDILLWYPIGSSLVTLNPTTTMQDLSDMAFVKKTPKDVLDNSVRYKGKVWGAILDSPIMDLLTYNKKVFTKLGLQVPQNFEELVDVCKTIKSSGSGVTPILMGGGDTWPAQLPVISLFNSALKQNPDLIDQINHNKAHFTDNAFVTAVNAMLELKNDGCFNDDALTMTYDQSVSALMSGKGAMEFTLGVPASAPTYSLSEVNSTEGVTGLSYSGNVASWQFAAGGYYLPKSGDSTREAEARKFVDFITGPYYQTYINIAKEQPLLSGATAPAGISQPKAKAYELFKNNSVAEFQQGLHASLTTQYSNWLVAMLGGKLSAKDVAQKLQASYSENAKQVGLDGF